MAVLLSLSKFSMFFLVGALFWIWETRDPLEKIDYKSELPGEGKRLFLIFLFHYVTFFVFALIGEVFIPSSIWQHIGLGGVLALPVWQRLIMAYLVADFSYYLVHRAQHHTKFMWLTHRWHHTQEPFWWLSGMRDSLAGSVIYRVFFFGWFPLFGIPAPVLFVVGLHYSLHVVWTHINVRGPDWMGIVEWVYATPRSHIIHHAAPGNNLGNMLTLWDRIFGTFITPGTIEINPERISSGEAETTPMILGI